MHARTDIHGLRVRRMDAANGQVYLGLLWLTLAGSFLVFAEPAPSDIGVACLFCGGMLAGWVSPPRYAVAPSALLLAFLALNLVPAEPVIDVAVALRDQLITVYLVAMWLLFVATLARHSNRGLRVAMFGYAAAALLSSGVSIYAYCTGSLMPHVVFGSSVEHGRVKGFFKDPNVYGPFLIPVLVLAIQRVSERSLPAERRVMWCLALAVVSVGLLLSFSRAAYLNCVVAILVLLLLTAREASSVFRIAMVVGTVGVIVWLALTNTPALRFAESRLTFQGYDDKRFTVMREAWQIGIQHPFGIGSGQSEYHTEIGVHNFYLRTFAEHGPIASILLLGFVWLTVRRAWTVRKVCADREMRQAATLCLACILGILANGFFVEVVHWRHFWLLLALPWCPVSVMSRVTARPALRAPALVGSAYRAAGIG